MIDLDGSRIIQKHATMGRVKLADFPNFKVTINIHYIILLNASIEQCINYGCDG